MEQEFVQVEIKGSLGLMWLNRPEKANAYHTPFIEDFINKFALLEADLGVHVLLVCARGRVFCAGADLGELRRRDPLEALDLKSARAFDRLARSTMVTMAVINGPAVAGGLELALACDLRIACPQATFGLPEVALGLVPAAGGLRRLPRLIGVSRAKAVILGGKSLRASDALACGLLSEIAEREVLLDRAIEWASEIAKQKPLAMRLAKEAIDAQEDDRVEARLEAAFQALLYKG